MNNYTHVDKQLLAGIFKRFATECGTAPLYQHLAIAIAEDADLLDLAAFTREKQPLANMLFAAVHYLLLQDPDQELAGYYPNLTSSPRPIAESYPVFKAFCIKQEEKIIPLIADKATQTNAINRSAYLMPVISQIADQENQAVNLVEIGPSAGLNLWWDDFKFDYQHKTTSVEYGAAASQVVIRTKVVGDRFPSFKNQATIGSRVGVDQNPIDLNHKEEADWLKALIWPDHTERFERMSAAITQVGNQAPTCLRQGNTLQDFRVAVDALPKDQLLVIYHTHVLYQFDRQEREEFQEMLDDISRERDFYYLNVEGTKAQRKKYDTKDYPVELVSYKKLQKTESLMAITNGHANWIQFM